MALSFYVATTSQGKLLDFQTAAKSHSIEINPLPDLSDILAPEEDGVTFADNATLKAVYYSHFAPGQFVLADDSGLEVDALSGAPGVRSARFAADSGMVDSPDANDNTDVWNNIVLLQRLEAVPEAKRTARYRCVLVAARDGETVESAEGAVAGLFSKHRAEPADSATIRSSICLSFDCTMAEINLETKHSLSHRGKAFQNLLAMLRARFAAIALRILHCSLRIARIAPARP